jgi:hypothetical protein
VSNAERDRAIRENADAIVYACAACGREITPSEVLANARPCGHDTSAITASLTATATGEGGM